jgi:Zn-dependent peptidase ImmA (M78 family)
MVTEHIEDLAEKILTESGVNALPIAVETIATNFRIRISRAPSTDFSGMLIRKDGYALIGINSKEAAVRQRFSVAHELGHFFLHKEKDAFIDYRDKKGSSSLTPRERQADMFAAALLMPRKMVEMDARQLGRDGLIEDEIDKLAERYEVSSDAMRYRLINLNLARTTG